MSNFFENNESVYKQKYLKYKQKYLILKEQLVGGEFDCNKLESYNKIKNTITLYTKKMVELKSSNVEISKIENALNTKTIELETEKKKFFNTKKITEIENNINNLNYELDIFKSQKKDQIKQLKLYIETINNIRKTDDNINHCEKTQIKLESIN